MIPVAKKVDTQSWRMARKELVWKLSEKTRRKIERNFRKTIKQRATAQAINHKLCRENL